MTRSNVPLADRPFSTVLCACGCGKFARVDSDYFSTHCGRLVGYKKYRERFKGMGEDALEEKHVCPDTVSWEDRWQNIYAKYGVNKENKK